MQSVIPVHGEVYSIQIYVTKFSVTMGTPGSFTYKTERHDRTDHILLKVALNTISQHHLTYFNIDSCLCFKKIFVFSWCVFFMLKTDSNKTNSIIDVMVNVLASNVVDRWFESSSGQTNDYKIVFLASPLSTQI